MALPTAAVRRAAELDAADPLAGYVDRYVPAPDVVAYFDGNSLGRPLRGVAERLAAFTERAWGGSLIRGWTEQPEDWMAWPGRIGDRLGRVALGAAPGQVVVADATSVLLYKLARAAFALRPGRDEVVLDRQDFPTVRYVVEGIAAERGLVVRWITSDPAAGVTPELVAEAVGPRTALAVFSHVAYRSAWVADAAAVTAVVREAGALTVWDVSHSAGVLPVGLDAWGVDLAVGCTYKFLGGGPGSPAFAYVRAGLQGEVRQPIQGWLGRRDPFAMEQGYEPAEGRQALISGTPPILAMVPLEASLDVLEEAGIDAVRAKSVALTGFALELADAWLPGVAVASPRDPGRRGGHVTLRRAGFRAVLDELWRRGVLADYREPDGIRIGLSPLSTSFAEVARGLAVLRDVAAEPAP